MRMRSLYLTIIAFTLYAATHSSLVYQYLPNIVMKENFKKELAELSRDSISKFDFAEVKCEDETLGSILLKHIKQEAIPFDQNALEMTVEEKLRPVLKEKDTGCLMMEYSFEFEVKDVRSSGSFVIKSKEYTATKKYENDESSKLYKSTATVQFDLFGDKISLGNQDYKDAVIKCVTKFISDSKPKMVELYNQDVSEYFKSLTYDFIVPFVTYFPERSYIIDLTLDQAPTQITDNFWNIPRKGQISLRDPQNKEPEFEDKEKYQMIIHRQVIYDIMTNLIEKNNFAFRLQKENRPVALYNLDINYLGIIVPEVLQMYSRSEGLRVDNTLNKISYDERMKDTVSGKFTIHSEIALLSTESVIFKFESDFAFKSTPKFSGLEWNLLVDSNSVSFEGYRVLSKMKVINSDIFISWIEGSVKAVLKKEAYQLFKNPFNMGKFFGKIDEGKFDGFGYKFLGEYP